MNLFILVILAFYDLHQVAFRNENIFFSFDQFFSNYYWDFHVFSNCNILCRNDRDNSGAWPETFQDKKDILESRYFGKPFTYNTIRESPAGKIFEVF